MCGVVVALVLVGVLGFVGFKYFRKRSRQSNVSGETSFKTLEYFE